MIKVEIEYLPVVDLFLHVLVKPYGMESKVIKIPHHSVLFGTHITIESEIKREFNITEDLDIVDLTPEINMNSYSEDDVCPRCGR